MVHRHYRAGFCQTVSLNDQQPLPSPKFFQFGVKRCPAGDKGPEFPAEGGVDSSKTAKSATLHFVSQILQYLWHGDGNRDVIVSNNFDNFPRMYLVREHRRTAEQHRNVNTESLSE